mmetsp:Transcript_5800/g.10277  ORF Transcript_5800/g.10277 Transcript_5800/m.10277 type:complete len:406 (-) Transcript_5800:212-1429(-)
MGEDNNPAGESLDIFGYSQDDEVAASYDTRNVNRTIPPYKGSLTTLSTDESSLTQSENSPERRLEHLRQQRARAVETYYAQHRIESHTPKEKPSPIYQSDSPQSLTRKVVIGATPPGRPRASFNTGINHQSFDAGRNHQSFDTGRHPVVAKEEVDAASFSLDTLEISRRGGLKSPAPFIPKKGGLKKPNTSAPLFPPREIEVVQQTEIQKDKSAQHLIRKNLSFSSVEIRFYNPCLGDNPAVSSGPSLSIDWDFDPSLVANMSINEYETKRPPRRRELAMVMTREEREEIVRNAGATKQQIAEHVRQNIKIKNQRRQTANNLSVSNVEEAVEKARRKVGKVFFKTKKKVEVPEAPVDKKNIMYEQWKASMLGEADIQERKTTLNGSGRRDDVSELGSVDGSFFHE